MNLRTLFAAALGVSLLTAGCAGSVAGQAEMASGAVLAVPSNSAPAPLSGTSSVGTSSSQAPFSTAESSVESAGESSAAPSTEAEDSSVALTSVADIPGLSKDCTTVLAAITAFSQVLQNAGSTDTISQAMVDQALQQLPASGLPTQPQADITVLRATVAGAAGETLTDLAQTLTDGKVVAALDDLSSWAQDHCG